MDRPRDVGTPSTEIAPRSRIVEAQEQVEQRALAGAGRADDGDLLAGRTAKETPSSAG
jgi:hypothetical protein